MALDSWSKGEEQDAARAKRLAASYVAAAAVVATLLGVGVAFGGQIKKRVLEEEVTVKFVPREPVKLPDPPKPPPAPPPKAAPKSAAAKGAHRDPPPTAIPNKPPEEGDPNNAKKEEAVGDPNGVVGGTGRGGGGAPTAPPAPPAPPPAPPPPIQQIVEAATPPVQLSKSMPAYPDDARRQGIEAVVVVKFVVDELGRVRDVKILRGHPLFDDVVLSAIRSWTFQPGTIDGKPTRITRKVKIPFRLKAS